jgi:GT2 family glycosyltransferase
MSPHASVIIPNWNGHSLLTECLAALRAQTFRDFEIIVVDNGSRDGSVEWLAEQAPDVIVIRNETNLGFAVANNQGFRAARAPLLVALNNDALPEPAWLQVLVETAAREMWAGMLACRIVRRDPAGVIDSLGIEVDRAGVAWNRAWGRPTTDRLVYQPAEVFGPSGAAAVYRRALLDQIGLFDEDLFAYYEDVDLAWRAQRAGARCLYVPDAIVHHLHSATSKQGSAFKTRLLGRNKWWVIAKNYPFASLWYYVPVMLVLDLAAVLLTSIRGRNLAALQGRWAALRGWGQLWRKRAALPPAGRPAIAWRQRLVAVQLARWRAA